MEQRHTSDTEKLIATLRRRAQSLRNQATWTHQACTGGRGPMQLHRFINEVIAMREESVVLDSLADQYEQSRRRGLREGRGPLIC